MISQYRIYTHARRTLLSTMLFAAAMLTFAACSKSPQSEAGGVETEMAMQFEEGSPEYRLRSLIDELTVITAAQSRDPESAVQQVRRFVESNRRDLDETNRDLEATYAGLALEERQAYADQLSDYLQDVTSRWYETLEKVRTADENAAARIESMLTNILR